MVEASRGGRPICFPWALARLLPSAVRVRISLAVNSTFGRSHNQLHIHIDCIGSDVKAALRRQPCGDW